MLNVSAYFPDDYSGADFDLADYITPQFMSEVSGMRVDSAGTALFLRDLTTVLEQTYDVKYPDLIARQILSVDTRVNPGADYWVWRQFDKRGTAKVVDNWAADFPVIDVQGVEFESRIFSLGASFQYTMQELRGALMAGIPLETRKGEQVRRAIEQGVEQIAAFGMSKVPGSGIPQGILFPPNSVSTTDYLACFGLTNFPNILNAYATAAQYPGQVTGAGTTTGQTSNNWTLASTAVSTILADINLMQRTMIQATKGVHRPDTLLLGTATWSALATLARSPVYTDDSVLQYIQKQSPWIKSVIFWPVLDTAGLKQDNATPGERVILMERRPENQQLIIPLEFEQLPPQQVGMAFKVPCHQRFGGVSIKYPFSVVYLDGAAG